MKRYLHTQLLNDLNDKMVLLAGPRQVGKTTLAKSLSKKADYMNWDIDEDRSRVLRKEFRKADLWIFDEIHKYKNWRNFLKGIFDKLGKEQRILVTGSAKLDVLRRGGDSLQGRYHFLRLMPLSYKELGMKTVADAKSLLALSGFPEPFFRGTRTYCDRWSRSYRERIVRQEISSNEQFLDLATIEIMFQRLPEIAGGILSINSLSEDLQVAHKTLSKWIQALERLYAVFRLAPFGPPRVKAVKKEQKLYFYDWNAVEDEGLRFENFVAVHLLKWVLYQQDTLGRNLDLRFYRDKADREVDFVIIEGSKPIMFVECKLSDAPVTRGLRYLKGLYRTVDTYQVHLSGKKEYVDEHGIEVKNVINLLRDLV